jgi:putative hydrolase of the HAD superfamily
MERLRYPIVLFDAGETLVAPRESFGAVYARVLATLGVVLDPADLERGLRRCWADTNATLSPGVDRYGSHPGGESGYWLRFVEGTLARTPGVHDHAELAAGALAPLREAFRDPASWTVFDDVVPALAALSRAGARLAIVSNWDSSLPGLLDALDLARWFDTIVVSHLEGFEKPRPELFLRAVTRLAGVPDEALHIGDVPELDEAGARAAGIASLTIDRRARLHASHRALRDLSGVPAFAQDGSI